MKKHVILISLIASTMVIGGCAYFAPASEPAPAASDSAQKGQPAAVSAPVESVSTAQDSQTTIGRINAQMAALADQIEKNADRKNLDNTFLVTSFTNLNRLSETTSFGRLVAENVIHELQVRKWKVFEVRLAKDVFINETGEFSLSRDIRKLKESYKVGGIITGTYSIAAGHVVVNARVIDIDSGLVSSSARIHMPVNWFTDSLQLTEDNQKTMKIVGDVPYVGNGDAAKPVKNEGLFH